MSVRQELIIVLEENRGKWLSGAEIAVQLDVSRSAVWKAIKSLQEDGYEIEAVTNRGYRFADDNDIISAAGIRMHLGRTADNLRIEAYQQVTSTNTLVRERAEQGAPEGLVIVAGAQTEGRGRFSRPFFSPANTGLYMSVLLRPPMSAQEAGLITSAAAVAVTEAIEETVGKTAGIKWVNDVFVDDRKVCGILTEAAVSMEAGSLEYAIPGIGINVYRPEEGFPPEIAEKAGAVCAAKGPGLRNRLAASVLDHFMRYYPHLSEKSFLSAYRARSFVPGHDILVMEGRGP